MSHEKLPRGRQALTLGGDIENARAFAAAYRGRFAYVPKGWARSGWYKQIGYGWTRCTRGEHVEAAKALATRAVIEAKADLEATPWGVFDHDGRDAWEHANERHEKARRVYNSAARIKAMMRMAESEAGIVSTPRDLQRADEWRATVRRLVG